MGAGDRRGRGDRSGRPDRRGGCAGKLPPRRGLPGRLDAPGGSSHRLPVAGAVFVGDRGGRGPGPARHPGARRRVAGSRTGRRGRGAPRRRGSRLGGPPPSGAGDLHVASSRVRRRGGGGAERPPARRGRGLGPRRKFPALRSPRGNGPPASRGTRAVREGRAGGGTPPRAAAARPPPAAPGPQAPDRSARRRRPGLLQARGRAAGELPRASPGPGGGGVPGTAPGTVPCLGGVCRCAPRPDRVDLPGGRGRSDPRRPGAGLSRPADRVRRP